MAGPALTKKTGKCLPLCMTKAIQKTVPKIQKKRRLLFLQNLFVQEGITKHPDQVTLTDFVSKHSLAAQKVQQNYNVRWMVAKKIWRKKEKHVQLVYDGSHATVQDESSPIHYFLLNAKNVLERHTVNSIQDMQPLSKPIYKKARIRKRQPLGELLGLDMDLPGDPQTKEDLETFLKQHTPPQTKVCVHFVHSPSKDGILPWMEIANPQNGLVSSLINIVAWTRDHYIVAYTKQTDPYLAKIQKRGKKLKPSLSTIKKNWKKAKTK